MTNTSCDILLYTKTTYSSSKKVHGKLRIVAHYYFPEVAGPLSSKETTAQHPLFHDLLPTPNPNMVSKVHAICVKASDNQYPPSLRLLVTVLFRAVKRTSGTQGTTLHSIQPHLSSHTPPLKETIEVTTLTLFPEIIGRDWTADGALTITLPPPY
ncbi:hypothetical protein CEXT_782961 [Caerostris extrusa]|uniref:Uncharacterized protein n=1 Tax=Caerostris extrusa TaxID=172846 RepID=A0AAV4R529_CAEEX|nr:hypothetical protein CEXT_782961 [Caerostris extrusa]